MSRSRRHAIDQVAIAANNGEVAGGEIMLLRIAGAMQDLGVGVTVVGPSQPNGLVRSARERFRTVELAASNRRGWMSALRSWDRAERRGLLWCNGLVPALATAGRPGRIVHLHQQPRGPRGGLARISRLRAVETLVPSDAMRAVVRGARVFPNWTPAIDEPEPLRDSQWFTVGFLGRLSPDKGVHVLADALARLDGIRPGRFRLALAGAPMFVSDDAIGMMEAKLASIQHMVDRRGWIPPEELFRSVDLLVVPSTVPESFGLVAAEAIAARVPVLVSDIGGLPEVVGRDSATLVKPDDPVALADAILEIYDGRLELPVDELYDRWVARFSPEAGEARLRELLADLGIGTRNPAVSDSRLRGAPGSSQVD